MAKIQDKFQRITAGFLWLGIVLLLAGCGGRSQAEPTLVPEATAVEEVAVDPQDQEETTAIDGRWEGAISIAGTELDIIVQLISGPDGLSATIDIPQQGASELPLDDVRLEGNAISFAIGAAGANFVGDVAGDSISGSFEQSGLEGTFAMSRTGDAVVEAVPEVPYLVEEATWPLGDTTMTGTVTIPEGDGPYPAVIFIAGSGPTDRDWNSPLLPGRNGSAALLADELTRAGFATMRFDKRATGPNAAENLEKLSGRVSLQSHLDEVVSAVNLLTNDFDIDTQQLFLLGNSEGTLHALNYQASDPALPAAGLILTAAPGRPLSAVLQGQIGAQLDTLANGETLKSLFNEAVESFVANGSTELDPSLPDGVQQVWASLVAPVNQPFSRELMAADPAAILADIDVPVLVTIGQKDVQVDWQADGGRLEITAGDNVTFEYPPNANHVLKLEERPAAELSAADGAFYNMADRVLDPEMVQGILDWLRAQAAE